MLQNRELANGSVAIPINGKTLYQRVVGFTMLASNNKVSSDINTEYRISSTPKMFTATIIFQLIDEKEIKFFYKIGYMLSAVTQCKLSYN